MSKNYNWDEVYSEYLKQLDKSTKAANKVVKALNQELFEYVLQDYKKTLKLMGKHALSAKQIARKLAVDDVYTFSFKQAKAFKKAYKIAGEKAPSMQSLRAHGMTEEFKAQLRARNAELKAQGVSSGYERAKIIGIEFFGS